MGSPLSTEFANIRTCVKFTIANVAWFGHDRGQQADSKFNLRPIFPYATVRL